MKKIIALLLLPLLLAGCWGKKRQSAAPSDGATVPASNSKLIVTPETALTGKVVSANANAKFVVLNFPIGRLPSLDQRLNVYRNGLKVGEVKVDHWQRDDNTVADIIAGEAKAGDEVREN